MALIKDGYFQDTYWAGRYWQEDYWAEYGTAAPPPSAKGGADAVWLKPRSIPRRDELPYGLMVDLREWLQIKQDG